MLCQDWYAARAPRQSSLLYADEATSTAAGLDWSLLRARKMRVSMSAKLRLTTMKMVITSVSAMVTVIIMSMKVTSTVMTATAATKC